MLKVLFVNAVDASSEVENRYNPLWPAYLAAHAELSLGPGQIEFRFLRGDLKAEILSYQPDIVGIGSVSQNFDYALDLARVCKESGRAEVVVGGPHISAMPNCLSENMDVGCLGEGEETFLELVRLFLDKGQFTETGLGKIEGIIYRAGNRLIQTTPRAPIRRLDQIPHPKRPLIGYHSHDYMFTSRGCPYRCVFCFSSRFWNTVRFASPEYVVEEIEELVGRCTKMISFYDDLFIANRNRVRRIADLVVDRGLNAKAQFTCSCRANLVTKEIVGILKRMNVVSVGLGLESGSDRILKYLKGDMEVADNERAVNLLKDAGIQANASFVIGAPDETREEIMETYRFIKRSRLDFVDTYVLTALPGTPIWELASQRGLVSLDMEWRSLNVNFERNSEKAIIVSETLSREEIIRYYRRFRRQRLYRIVKALPRSPWIRDVPRLASKLVLEKVSAYGRRILRK